MIFLKRSELFNGITGILQTMALAAILGLVSCQSDQGATHDQVTPIPHKDSTTNIALSNYEEAKQAYLKSPNDPDALIWYGRRTAYLGEYEEAIKIYSEGIQKHPDDARMYRHRGHRYISVRQYDQAIQDLEYAATLIEGQEDQIEPDGLPNNRNIPLSTLHGNIWYHLGLAYYLKHDLEKALSAYSNRTVTERYPDNLVSGGHWLYMILRRLGREQEANAAIEDVVPNMDIIENKSYYDMCLFYKQLITEAALKPEGDSSSSNDVYNYGLGNWYLYHKQDTLKAKAYYEDLLKHGNQYSFAYLAAESDWNRLFPNTNPINE